MSGVALSDLILEKPAIADRIRVAGLHLVFSVLLLGGALFLVFSLWYPAPLHKVAGASSIFMMMLVVDVIPGPLLTFVVLKKDRRKLIFDLSVILLAQLAAFFYGLNTLAQGRPVWLVFVVDDFELVSSVGIDRRQEARFAQVYRDSLWDGPRWAAALYSDDPELLQEQREDEIFSGISLAQRPETYAPLSVKSAQILEKAYGLEELKKFNAPEEVIETLAGWPEAKGWLPLKAEDRYMVVLLGRAAGVLAVVDLQPW